MNPWNIKLTPQNPQNILFKVGDTVDSWILGDFGLSRIIRPEDDETNLRSSDEESDAWQPSPYSAPEATFENRLRPKSDVWAVGCVLLDVLSYACYGYLDGYKGLVRLRCKTYRGDQGVRRYLKFHAEGTHELSPKVQGWIRKIETDYPQRFIIDYLRLVKEILLPEHQRNDARYFYDKFSLLFPEAARVQNRKETPSINIHCDDLGISIPERRNEPANDHDGHPSLRSSSFPPSSYHTQPIRPEARQRHHSDTDRRPSRSPRRSPRRSLVSPGTTARPNIGGISLFATGNPFAYPAASRNPTLPSSPPTRSVPNFSKLKMVDTVCSFSPPHFQNIPNTSYNIVISH